MPDLDFRQLLMALRAIYTSIAVTGTANVLELTWTTLAAVAVLLHLRGVAMTITDARWLAYEIRSGTSGYDAFDEIVARGNMRAELFNLVMQLGFLAIGLISMALPGRSDVDPSTVAILASVISPSLLLTLEVLLVVRSVLDNIDRERIRRNRRHGRWTDDEHPNRRHDDPSVESPPTPQEG